MFLFKKSLPKRDFYTGLIGCGHFVKFAYVPAFNNPGNPIACSGLYSRSVRSAREVCRNLRYKSKVFTSYEDLVSSGITSVIITAPNNLHYYYIIESLNRNLDIFCEKPVVNNLKDVYHLKSLLEKSRNILMIGFNQRYLDRIRKLKLLIKNGDIGKIKEVHAFHNQNIVDHLLRSDWLSDKTKSGGGVLHNAGVHLVNIMLYLFGKIDKVSAEFQNIKMPVSFGEDTASCRFIFKSGVCGFLKASFVNAVDSNYEHIIIKTDKASIKSSMLNNDIIINNDSGYLKSIDCNSGSIPDSIYNELVHFYDCIKNRKIPDTDIDDSIETLRVAEAARISAIEKREICLDEIKKA